MSKKKHDYAAMSDAELEKLLESPHWRISLAAQDELERREVVGGATRDARKQEGGDDRD